MKLGISFILTLLVAGFSFGQIDEPEIIKSKELSERILSKKFSAVPAQVKSFHAIGTINVLVNINEAGNVENVKMLSGFNHVVFLCEYIEKEVLSWKFKPVKKKEKQIRFRGVISIPFYYGTFPKKLPTKRP